MTHMDEYESIVIRYLDGELDGWEAETFAAHLNDCPDCARVLSAHRESLRFVQSALNNPPSSTYVSSEQVARRVSRRRRMRFAIAAASGFIVIAAVVFVAIGNEPAERPLFTEASPAIEPAPTELELRIALLEAKLSMVQAELDRTAERNNLEEQLVHYEFASIAVAAAQHLEESGLDYEGAREQYLFVADHYPDSLAAATANARLAAMTINSSTT